MKIVFHFFLWMYGGRAGLVYEVGISVLLLLSLPELSQLSDFPPADQVFPSLERQYVGQ